MRTIRKQREAGVAAVELAIVLPLLFMTLLIPIFFGIYFYQYTVVNKAAQSAARYMSGLRRSEITSPVLVAGARAFAAQIAADMTADLKAEGLTIDVDCDNNPCSGGNNAPVVVKVVVEVRLRDLFGLVDTGQWGLTIQGQSVMKYAGY